MSWLRGYHANLVDRIRNGSLYDSVGKLEALWPFLIGGGLFAAIDIGFGLANPLRSVLLAILLGPGALWALYITILELKALPGKYRRHRNGPE